MKINEETIERINDAKTDYITANHGTSLGTEIDNLDGKTRIMINGNYIPVWVEDLPQFIGELQTLWRLIEEHCNVLID